ncbi:MAG: acetate/propionate family kinase [Pseudomonadota bacterium]
MTDGILVLDAGSSSLKAAVFRAEIDAAALLKFKIGKIGADSFVKLPDGRTEPVDAPDHISAIHWLLERIRDTKFNIVAAGHRVVHGGQRFTEAVRVTTDVEAEIERLYPLARTHNPNNLAGIRACAHAYSDLPQVACFDTAFHRTIPEIARTFALPRSIRDQGVERYGFHGLSYAWIASRLPVVDQMAAQGKTIIAHLGNGSSMCALKACRCVATTMGFTTLDGLMMGRRPGLLDPGIVLYMQSELGMSLSDVERLLFKESGLLGVSGVSNDVRTLSESEEPEAKKAIILFQYNAIRMIGSLAASLGGLDAIVFTGGIGENAADIREGIMNGCRWLGVVPDEEANAKRTPGHSTVTTPESVVKVHVIPTNEEAVIARDTRAVLGL